MTNTVKKALCVLLAFLILAATLLGGCQLWQAAQNMRYPQKYSAQISRWAAEYQLDPLLLYAVIRTESGFDPQAQSSVDARGLMQITEVTFDWIKQQIASDEAVTFADLYEPEINIRFGSYYFKRCLARYNDDVSTAAAAYHSGWGTVDGLLADTTYSADGTTLHLFPYKQMKNYVAKINRAYQAYRLLYCPEGEEK